MRKHQVFTDFIFLPNGIKITDEVDPSYNQSCQMSKGYIHFSTIFLKINVSSSFKEQIQRMRKSDHSRCQVVLRRSYFDQCRIL